MTEIAWRAWSEEAFTEAQLQNKPVLLSIVAPWCQFCRAMDEQTFSNEAIAQFIGDNLIPVRVDSDKRPDVNGRYTQGGWPTTCVLSPEGDLIWGGTFVPADGMAQLLPQIVHAFRNDKQGMANHIAQTREQVQQQTTAPPLDASLQVTPDIVRNAVLGAKQNFDFAFGGFGKEQKFPHVDALELCLEQYAASVRAGQPDADFAIMLEKTLVGMVDGDLHDQGAGGFFRYTQTPDWRAPQVEKLLEDNALVARSLAHAYQVLGDERWHAAAKKTISYLDDILYDTNRGTWGASQYADAEYYAQPLAERADWNPPTVDPTVLAGPNSLAVRAHVAWWQATGDTASLEKAKLGLDFITHHLLKPDGALDHFLPEDDTDLESVGRIPTGLLSDSADYIAAALDLYEAGQGVSYLDSADLVASWVRGHLEDPRGSALFDSVVRPDAVGNLKVGTKDVPDNMQAADALLRLYLLTGDEEHARLAQRTLQAFIPASSQLGFFGAGFALAAQRALLPPILVHVLGNESAPETQALVAAANRAYRFERAVQPLDPANPDDAEHIETLGYKPSALPVAYVCVATRCLEPTSDADALSGLVSTAS
ncbi:MAG: thioredoxin domain-containing protein [Cytophagales bacterium]|nr:thioredoxin domain-containing protein [Armatimonadota bacterium]